MTGILELVFILAIGALAVFFGGDLRLPEDRRSL